ncbi:MAG: sugar phosphate isomerase/epimerase [Mesorhizobium sp.]|nr:MAG: sugar phosphate isomerase/epimerase [Mesorhizobium sp.]
MLRVGLNPYGLTYHLGLQGRGTPRANPKGAGLEGFIALAEELGARTLEIYDPWLAEMSDSGLAALKERLDGLGMTPVVSAGLNMMGPLESAFRSARSLGAKTIRLGLTPVLCGDRNAWGEKWGELNASIRSALQQWGPRAEAEGRVLAIENHQDFGSAELVAFCETGGRAVGITFDTGNTFPVAEAPLDFTRRVAPYVRHVHLKDYRVQFTGEGYRLVRCAIGDGAVPFRELAALLGDLHDELTAVLEPGALEARHVRFLSDDWWNGYPPKTAREFAACLAAAQENRLPGDADFRTPWERGDDGALVSYELDMIRRSAANMKALGLMTLENPS